MKGKYPGHHIVAHKTTVSSRKEADDFIKYENVEIQNLIGFWGPCEWVNGISSFILSSLKFTFGHCQRFLCSLNLTLYFTWFLSSPLEDYESHKANHDCGEDGAIDGYEFVVQPIVEWLLGIPSTGGGISRGAVCWTLWWDCVRWKDIGAHGVGCERIWSVGTGSCEGENEKYISGFQQSNTAIIESAFKIWQIRYFCPLEGQKTCHWLMFTMTLICKLVN